MPTGKYGGLSLPRDVLDLAWRYAKEDGYVTPARLVRYLIENYPKIREGENEEHIREIIREELHRELDAFRKKEQ